MIDAGQTTRDGDTARTWPVRSASDGRRRIRLVVTGANGYVGGRFVSSAAASGRFDIRAVVRSPAPWLSGSVYPVASLEGGAKEAIRGADAVVHLAGANETVVQANPDEAVESTVAASRVVAQACAGFGVDRLVYVSTVHVYGSALKPGALVDEQTPPAPTHPYAVARWMSEQVIASVAEGVEVAVLRLTNGVGPPAHPSVNRWSLVVNDLCRQVVCGGHVKLRSDGTQWRDFVALDDVDRVLLAAADPAGIPPGTYNVGSGQPRTVLEVASEVARLGAGSGLCETTVEAPPPVAELAAAYRVSIDRLLEAGLRPSTSLTKAIGETLEFCSLHRKRLCGELSGSRLSDTGESARLRE